MRRVSAIVLVLLFVVSAKGYAQRFVDIPPDTIVAMTMRQAFRGVSLTPEVRTAAESRIWKFIADRDALPKAAESTREAIANLRIVLVGDLRKLVPTDSGRAQFDTNMRNALPGGGGVRVRPSS